MFVVLYPWIYAVVFDSLWLSKDKILYRAFYDSIMQICYADEDTSKLLDDRLLIFIITSDDQDLQCGVQLLFINSLVTQKILSL